MYDHAEERRPVGVTVLAPTAPEDGGEVHIDDDCPAVGPMHRETDGPTALGERGLEPCDLCCPPRVLVAGTSGGNRVAHTKESCRYVSDSHSRWDTDTALAWGIEVCEACRDLPSRGGW